MVKVKLAGINVPINVLDELQDLREDMLTTDLSDSNKKKYVLVKLDQITKKFTPEIISAAYARISRKPEDVNQLVEEAIKDVVAARKSNESIIYGMGHHSVADHAIFNFNITGISRLAIEDFEKRRIGVGYTEKSQRYITLSADLNDIVQPKEFSSPDSARFNQLIEHQNKFYHLSYPRLHELLLKMNADEIRKLEGKPKEKLLNRLDGLAKEDARFGVGLATKGQLGGSLTGQALEHMIRTLKYGRLIEDKEIAEQLFAETKKFAPSLIQLTDPEVFRQHNPGKELMDDNFEYTENNLRELVQRTFMENRKDARSGIMTKRGSTKGVPGFFTKDNQVTMMKSADVDMNIITSLLHEYSFASIEECHEMAYNLINKGKGKAFVDDALKYLSAYDKLPRAFEMNNGMMFEAVISASGFAQLKRHRLMTLLAQDYNPELGITVPPNIEEIGLGEKLENVAYESGLVHDLFKPKYGKKAAEYCLTNAHRRRTITGINTRELCHVSRTREDDSAQWEIRGIVTSMSKLAKEEAPLTTRLIGGQDKFQKIRESVYDNKK